MDLGDVGIAVSGGGAIPANFSAGGAPELVKLLLETFNLLPKYMIGVSAGAIIAAQTAAAITKQQDLDSVGDIWMRRLRGPEDIWDFPPAFKKLLSFIKFAEEKKKIPKSQILKILKDNTISEFMQLLSSNALFSNAPLLRLIDEELDMEAVINSPIKIEVAAVSNEGELTFFSNKNCTAEQFKKAIIASAALPAQLPPVLIGDKAYVDGGLKRPLVIAEMVHNLCDTAFIFSTPPSKNELSMPVDDFMIRIWWKRLPWMQAVRSDDIIDIIIDRFTVTNENIQNHEGEIAEVLQVIENPETKNKVEEIMRKRRYRFQKRHYVKEFIFKPEIVLTGHSLDFNSEDMKQGVQYGRQYIQREFNKRLGIIP